MEDHEINELFKDGMHTVQLYEEVVGNRQTLPLCEFIQLLQSKLDLIPEQYKKQAFLQFDLSEYNYKLDAFSPNLHIFFQRPETGNERVLRIEDRKICLERRKREVAEAKIRKEQKLLREQNKLKKDTK